MLLGITTGPDSASTNPLLLFRIITSSYIGNQVISNNLFLYIYTYYRLL
jgi:TctA family transporter